MHLNPEFSILIEPSVWRLYEFYVHAYIVLSQSYRGQS